jgi:hypothetical protein
LRYTDRIDFAKAEVSMDILSDINEHTAPATLPVRTNDEKQERRRRRLAALAAAEGIWKDRTDIPLDGVQYQNELRDEWR